MRPIIVGAWVVCLAVAAAPWLSGGQEPVAMLVSGAALLLGALLAWRQPAVRRLRPGPVVAVWVAFLGWGGLSLLWSANRFSTMMWLVMWVLAGLAFRLAYTIAGEARGRRWLLGGYLGSALVFCLVAIWMYLTSDYERLTGTFYWANPAAAYLIPALVLTWEGMRRAKRRRKWLGWAGLAVIFLATFVLTDSRGALLVLVLTGAVYLLVMPTNRWFWIKLLFIIGVGITLSFGLTKLSGLIVQTGAEKTAPGGRLSEAVAGSSTSGSDRVRYLSSAFEMWFDRPVLGSGAGTFGDVHPAYQAGPTDASRNAHNLYLQTLAELGLVGAALLAGVMLCLVVGLVRGAVRSPEVVPAVIGLGGLLVHFGLDIGAQYPALLLLAAVLAGAAYAQRRDERAKASWPWVAVAAVMLAPLAAWYQSVVWAERGGAAQQEGEISDAAGWYGQARSGLMFDPDFVNAEGIALYSLAAGGEEAREAAALALERAREAQALDPYDAQHYLLEARVLMLNQKTEEARVALEKALRLDPYNHPEYAFDLATIQLQQGDKAGAVATAERMLGLYPPEVVRNRSTDETVRPALANLEALVGNVWLAEGKREEAEAAARRALEIYPESLRGRALMRQTQQRETPAQ